MDIMNETLPISIKVSDALATEVQNILSITNKLSAQLNFHTMTANWYGDEANIMSINFYLVALAELTHLSTENEKLTVEKLADDVMLRANNNIFDLSLIHI